MKEVHVQHYRQGQKLKAEYRKTKDNRKKTGMGNKVYKYFDALNKILGHKPATDPPIVVDALAKSTQMKMILTIQMTALLMALKRKLLQPTILSYLRIALRQQSYKRRILAPQPQLVLPIHAHLHQLISSFKKRKRSKGEKMAVNVIEKVIDTQSESDV